MDRKEPLFVVAPKCLNIKNVKDPKKLRRVLVQWLCPAAFERRPRVLTHRRRLPFCQSVANYLHQQWPGSHADLFLTLTQSNESVYSESLLVCKQVIKQSIWISLSRMSMFNYQAP